jgi:cytochrome P450
VLTLSVLSLLHDSRFVTDARQVSSSIKTFFYSIALHPEVREKAQEEIDRIVGSRRLPDFNDRESMPYTEAIYREVMRIRPTIPMGVPHANTEDDVYNGYFIPKGRILLQIF